MASTSKITVLRTIFQSEFAAGTNGRDHVVDTCVGHAGEIVSLIGIAFSEETCHLGVEIRWCEPHAVSVGIAYISACTLIGARLWGHTIKRWQIFYCAPKIYIVLI